MPAQSAALRDLDSVHAMKHTRPRVLIAYKYIPQYRMAFFEGLRERLLAEGVVLDIAYGDPSEVEGKKSDAVSLSWAKYVSNRRIGWGSRELIYQPIVRLATSYDLVIVEQANKLLVNPILIFLNMLGAVRLAYWGHGRNFQEDDGVFSGAVKRALIRHVHWWFSYNETSASVVQDAGFDNRRIAKVFNTIDNEELSVQMSELTQADAEDRLRHLGLTGRNVCVYVGGMYDKKRLPFLIEACKLIRIAVPDFEIVFMGSGANREQVDAFVAENSWAVACGPTFGHEKALNMKLAKLLLMPGLVGLAVIDAFVAGVPIVTTNVSYHSPEIEYVIDGVNGKIVRPSDDVHAYARAVAELLLDQQALDRLRLGCAEAARRYTLQNMINNFTAGVLSALRA